MIVPTGASVPLEGIGAGRRAEKPLTRANVGAKAPTP